MPTPSQAESQDSEGVETRRHPSKLSNQYDEGIVQGVVKITQTGILWSQVQVLVGPPEMKIPTSGLVFFLSVTLSNGWDGKLNYTRNI